MIDADDVPARSNLSLRRTCYRWAMTAHKGGRCVRCSGRVTFDNFDQFNFHHINHLNNPHDLTERWNGPVRDWPPFTEKWLAWGETIELVCKACHASEHKRTHQMDIEEFLKVQARLEAFEPGLLGAKQQVLFGE